MIAPTGRAQISLRVGDTVRWVMLREVGGSVFDSWHQANAGRTQVYWIDPSLVGSVAEDLAARLAACDAELHLVASASPRTSATQGYRGWLIQRVSCAQPSERRGRWASS